MTSADPGSLSCDVLRTELDAWLDGGTSPAMAAAIEAHVASCSACARQLAHDRAYRRAMGRLSADARGPRAPAGLRDRLERLLSGDGGSTH